MVAIDICCLLPCIIQPQPVSKLAQAQMHIIAIIRNNDRGIRVSIVNVNTAYIDY